MAAKLSNGPDYERPLNGAGMGRNSRPATVKYKGGDEQRLCSLNVRKKYHKGNEKSKNINTRQGDYIINEHHV